MTDPTNTASTVPATVVNNNGVPASSVTTTTTTAPSSTEPPLKKIKIKAPFPTGGDVAAVKKRKGKQKKLPLFSKTSTYSPFPTISSGEAYRNRTTFAKSNVSYLVPTGERQDPFAPVVCSNSTVCILLN